MWRASRFSSHGGSPPGALVGASREGGNARGEERRAFTVKGCEVAPHPVQQLRVSQRPADANEGDSLRSALLGCHPVAVVGPALLACPDLKDSKWPVPSVCYPASHSTRGCRQHLNPPSFGSDSWAAASGTCSLRQMKPSAARLSLVVLDALAPPEAAAAADGAGALPPAKIFMAAAAPPSIIPRCVSQVPVVAQHMAKHPGHVRAGRGSCWCLGAALGTQTG